jgi:hypothetical protein
MIYKDHFNLAISINHTPDQVKECRLNIQSIGLGFGKKGKEFFISSQ